MDTRCPDLPDTARRLLEAQHRESLAAVTECMFAAAVIGAGERRLDVGTGAGDAAEVLVVEPGAFDVALARNSVMYLTDPPRALHLSKSLRQLLSLLPEDQHEEAWAEIAVGFRRHESAAGLVIPGEQVVLVATA